MRTGLLNPAGHAGMDIRQCGFQMVPEIRPLAHVVRPKAFASLERIRIPAAGDHNQFYRRSVWLQKIRANRQTVHFRHINVDQKNVRLDPT